jgi:hypothetical protein
MELNNSPWSLVALGGLFAVLGLLWTDRFYYFAMPFIAVGLVGGWARWRRTRRDP